MESVPLISKPKILPNLDALPLIRELFQEEFSTPVPSQNLSRNLLTSLQHEKHTEEEVKTFRSVDFLENFTNRKDNLIDFAENVHEAYVKHEKNLENIRDAEKEVFTAHIRSLNRQVEVIQNETIQNFLSLKRRPFLEALDVNYVKKYKLLQGDAGLPAYYEAKSDFRVADFKRRRKKLKKISQESLGYLEKEATTLPCVVPPVKKEVLPVISPKIEKKISKKEKRNFKPDDILRAEPTIIFFTDYKIGDIYMVKVEVRNIYSKGIRFQLKPLSPDGPFKVTLDKNSTTKIFPGLTIQLAVQFSPKTQENFLEEIIIFTREGGKLLIPLLAYLESPVLKTHFDVDELTRSITEKIQSSYIECGATFTGDTKVTKIRFRCYQGCGEFFIMNSENWNRSYINAVTSDNLLEIPPFRVYPVFFKIEKDQVIDLYVEFSPKTSGTQVENILIACNNGEIRSLDLLADAVGWHSYFFTFQESLLKSLPVDKDDDIKVKHYLDFEDTTASGTVEKTFCVSNNSNMSFEFQWKIREANIQNNQEKYLKLSNQVKIDPESGTFEPNSIWEFLVTISFNNAEVGDYRMVLSLYVLNLPYQCIEEDNTVIQPTGLVRNLYSQSLYGEEECTGASPELLSLQGTYESLQESIKSYVECQSKAQAVPKPDFCKTFCIPNPGLCAKPLKKSKTYFNIGENIEDEGVSSVSRLKPAETESTSKSCASNTKGKTIDSSGVRNDIIWDFVDVLVDEIELWVEVTPTRAIIIPNALDLSGSLRVNDHPVVKQVQIINYNRFPITCKWLKWSDKTDNENLASGNSFSLIFDNKSATKTRDKSKNFPDSFDESSEISRTGMESTQIMSKLPEKFFSSDTLDLCKIAIDPRNCFSIPGRSEYTCKISISPLRSGELKEELWLNINDGDLKLQLLIVGNVQKKHFTAFPELLDFGVLRQGTRYIRDYTILNEYKSSLFWKINQYNFDFNDEKFLSYFEVGTEGTEKKEGVLISKGNCVVEPYCMDARVPGIKCSLLEVEANENHIESFSNQYILVLGDVKFPVLSLSSPRFENAILAPSGMMYVGQKISTKVILTNKGSVETFFSWGHPFGCHCRKIKVEISPQHFRIEKKKKLTIDIYLTPLDEGIISHCYIPCFFCRSAEPLILSVVGIAENLHVTFEVIDYPKQTHADVKNFLKTPYYHTVLRVPWPIKTYNMTLDQKYICEEDIMNMKCYCSEIEEETDPDYKISKSEAESTEKSTTGTVDINDEADRRSKSMSFERSLMNSVEDFRDSTSHESSSTTKKSQEINSVQRYSFRESLVDSLQFVKSQLEFLETPFRTPVMRQFVIRNETPVSTSFQLSVVNFSQSENLPENKIEIIMKRVLGSCKDDFQWKLPKDQPLMLIVEPTEGELLGFDAVSINVYAYGNTWGEYRDVIRCQIKGIEVFHLKVLVQIIGHPINFPLFDNQVALQPVLRFQPVTCISEIETKKIKVVNRSAIPLKICWIVFLIFPVLQDEEQEETFNLCIDSNANLDSNHSGEESSKSTKLYLPKNASESISTFQNMLEMRDFSQMSGTLESLAKTDYSSEKKENQDYSESSKTLPVFTAFEEQNSEVSLSPFYGRVDNRVFQVEPKEMSFEPFEEKKMEISFNPWIIRPKTQSQEFKAVLTACVKLKPEDEKRSGIYYRPCGINFVSEVLNFDAVTETLLISFEIVKGDLKFLVDSNTVMKSPTKQYSTTRKFLFKNHNQKPVELKIEIVPEVIFHIKSLNTIDKFYQNYNPDAHLLKIEPEQVLEMELQCSVSYRDIIYAYEQLKMNRKKDQCPASSEFGKTSLASKSTNENDDGKGKSVGEPWQQYFNDAFSKKEGSQVNSCKLGHRDSFEINQNRLSSKSDNSICYDLYSGRGYFTEMEGEYLELTGVEELPCKPKVLQHVAVIEEEISFIQKGLVTQTVMAELHLSFPVIRVSPNCLDFGNVYIGEMAVRFCSLINVTGFPTDFKVKSRSNTKIFDAKPLCGRLPSTNYNSDIGTTITIEFKPSQPGYFKEVFHIYCNLDMEFDSYKLFVSGIGTWNEKYKFPKVEIYTKLPGPYAYLQK